jgi:hypothetical protein
MKTKIEARISEYKNEKRGLMVDFTRAALRYAGPYEEDEGESDLTTMRKLRDEMESLDAKISELRWVLSLFNEKDNELCPA